MDTTKTIPKTQVMKHNRPYMGAFIFLVIVLVATIAAWFFNQNLKTNISEIQNQISETQSKIDTMNAGSNLLQVSELYNKNKAVLARLEQRSQVVKYISHLSDISQKYNVSLSGFNYRDDIIASSLISTSKNAQPLAYKNVVKFLSEYNNDDKVLATLGYISNITGHDSMKFALNFTLK